MGMLVKQAGEGSTYVVTATFYDEAGILIEPTAVEWELTDSDGTTINSRTGVSETPASTITIVLSGADLAIVANDDLIRVITVTATYDSTNGDDLPLIEEIKFKIRDLTGVT